MFLRLNNYNQKPQIRFYKNSNTKINSDQSLPQKLTILCHKSTLK